MKKNIKKIIEIYCSAKEIKSNEKISINEINKNSKNNRILESIDLSKNFITEASAKNFFNNLNYNNSLKYINFHDNQMQNSIANIIINILRMNKTILKINLTANRIQLRMINEINKFLKRNASLEHEKFVPSLKENIKRLQFNPKELIELKKKKSQSLLKK